MITCCEISEVFSKYTLLKILEDIGTWLGLYGNVRFEDFRVEWEQLYLVSKRNIKNRTVVLPRTYVAFFCYIMRLIAMLDINVPGKIGSVFVTFDPTLVPCS